MWTMPTSSSEGPRLGPVRQLAYLGFSVRDLDVWQTFCQRVLGAVFERRGGMAAVQFDDRDYRLWLNEGPTDDLDFVGWQTTEGGLQRLVPALQRVGAEPVEDPRLAELRGVEHLVRFSDPAGIPSELVVGDVPAGTGFASKRASGGFLMGEHGLGHVALTSTNREVGESFYGQTLGMALRDRIVTTIGEYEIDLAFMGVNRRHHSVAVGGELGQRLHHFMLQYRTLDDLGCAYDRAGRAGCIATTLGRHPNDRMVSFYARTPSGFEVELGWGGLEVHEETWISSTYDKVAIWGHRPVLEGR